MFYKRFLVHPSIISVASRLLLTGLCAGKLAAFTVDGIRTPATESGYTVRAVQTCIPR